MLDLQSALLEESNGLLDVDLTTVEPMGQLKQKGLGYTVKSPTGLKARGVVGLNENNELTMWVGWNREPTQLLDFKQLLENMYVTFAVPAHLPEAVNYVIESCYAIKVTGRMASFGGAYTLLEPTHKSLLAKRLLVDDGHNAYRLKHFVRTKRLTTGEYGAITDTKAAAKFSHAPSASSMRLYRYRINKFATSSGKVEVDSVEAMLARYKATELHELWAGLEAHVFNYVNGKDEVLRCAALGFYSLAGQPIKFFTLEELGS